MSSRFRLVFLFLLISCVLYAQRSVVSLNKDWSFKLTPKDSLDIDGDWQKIDLPHDWSILGQFDSAASTTHNQGSLPAGVGWYKKMFVVPAAHHGKSITLFFDGVFQRATIWLNGVQIGQHANGYVSFKFDVTKLVRYNTNNELIVRANNSQQPNSRWYTGSGIYRKVWLDIAPKTHIPRWDVQIETRKLSTTAHELSIRGVMKEAGTTPVSVTLNGKSLSGSFRKLASDSFTWKGIVPNPKLWSPEQPNLYNVSLNVKSDQTTWKVGFRDFYFDAAKGFFLNGQHYFIKGVCMHHDLGALGAAVHPAAIKRQLLLLKEMGCNAIRTAHNPPSEEMLSICDSMGFLVMDELYDMWAKKKNKFDQYLDFKENWSEDVQNWVKRDRNHPSVFMWNIGNEIREQFDSSGIRIARQLAERVREFDRSRPVTSALTENNPSKNFIFQSGALDVLGFNYKHVDYPDLPKRFPGMPILASETASALSSRGVYELPGDSLRVWPTDSKPFTGGRHDRQVSAYDNTFAYWGTTHENAWLQVKKNPYLAGTFVWSGFDFLGEPVPYAWPSRSSYYGIIDLAGIPKDVFYMYQSEWTSKPVLHLLPHWNWKKGDIVDVWAYMSGAEEVELFLNDRSLGRRMKTGDSIHLSWKVPFEAGTLKAVALKNGVPVLTKVVHTSGSPAKLTMAKVQRLQDDSEHDLIFLEIESLDNEGHAVSLDQQLIAATITGATLLALDNGDATDHQSFTSSKRKMFNGKLVAIIRVNQLNTGKWTIEFTPQRGAKLIYRSTK